MQTLAGPRGVLLPSRRPMHSTVAGAYRGSSSARAARPVALGWGQQQARILRRTEHLVLREVREREQRD